MLGYIDLIVPQQHRDLHWGQILVKNVPTKSTTRRKTRISMDDADHGVVVTIIDLGLARMDSHGGTTASVHWTPFDEETFEGEGDYQFDVYRMMRKHNGDEWEAFQPFTNVMVCDHFSASLVRSNWRLTAWLWMQWLHYLTLKLLQSKRLRPPAVARKSTATQSTSGFSERECYECLKEVEGTLAKCLTSIKARQAPKRGRPPKLSKAKDVAGPRSARDLLAIATLKGWVV